MDWTEKEEIQERKLKGIKVKKVVKKKKKEKSW